MFSASGAPVTRGATLRLPRSPLRLSLGMLGGSVSLYFRRFMQHTHWKETWPAKAILIAGFMLGVRFALSPLFGMPAYGAALAEAGLIALSVLLYWRKPQRVRWFLLACVGVVALGLIAGQAAELSPEQVNWIARAGLLASLVLLHLNGPAMPTSSPKHAA